MPSTEQTIDIDTIPTTMMIKSITGVVDIANNYQILVINAYPNDGASYCSVYKSGANTLRAKLKTGISTSQTYVIYTIIEYTKTTD